MVGYLIQKGGKEIMYKIEFDTEKCIGCGECVDMWRRKDAGL
jgi:ferredoxin